MPAGRPRKPTPLKILHGEKNRDQVNYHEPTPIAKAPECPEYLDDIAREKWESIVPLLAGMGICSDAEITLIEMFCVAYSRWRACNEIIERDGVIDPVTHRRSTHAIEIHALTTEIHRMAAELGLSYVSRSRITTDPKDKPDEKEARFLG